jgi:hypothetical protein
LLTLFEASIPIARYRIFWLLLKLFGGSIVRKNSKKRFSYLDSPDTLGSTVEPYASPSYLLDDDDDIESELDPGILQHPGEPSNIAVFFHYYSSGHL